MNIYLAVKVDTQPETCAGPKLCASEIRAAVSHSGVFGARPVGGAGGDSCTVVCSHTSIMWQPTWASVLGCHGNSHQDEMSKLHTHILVPSCSSGLWPLAAHGPSFTFKGSHRLCVRIHTCSKLIIVSEDHHHGGIHTGETLCRPVTRGKRFRQNTDSRTAWKHVSV